LSRAEGNSSLDLLGRFGGRQRSVLNAVGASADPLKSQDLAEFLRRSSRERQDVGTTWRQKNSDDLQPLDSATDVMAEAI
jgi:hypothetical protein